MACTSLDPSIKYFITSAHAGVMICLWLVLVLKGVKENDHSSVTVPVKFIFSPGSRSKRHQVGLFSTG